MASGCWPSAGGGLAVATALMARDRGEPRLRAQVLIYLMLDCRGVTVSSEQFVGDGIMWDHELNKRSWRRYYAPSNVDSTYKELLFPTVVTDAFCNLSMANCRDPLHERFSFISPVYSAAV